jgi:hypothetical protein
VIEMRTDLVNRSSRFFGLLILLNLCWLSADLRDAEAVTAKVGTPAEGKFSCMIAKSVYGSPSFDEPVRRLHQFRDQVLMGSSLGRWVAQVYYRLSGSLAPHLDGDGPSGGSIRWTVRALLYLVKYLEAIGLGIGVVLIAFVLGRGAISVCRRRPKPCGVFRRWSRPKPAEDSRYRLSRRLRPVSET